DHHQLQEPGAIRIVINARLVDKIPEAVHHAFAEIVAVVAEEAITMVVAGGEVPGAETALTGHPYRRIGLLDRTRPEIDHGQFEVLPVPGEDLLCLPRLQNQVVSLIVAFAM